MAKYEILSDLLSVNTLLKHPDLEKLLKNNPMGLKSAIQAVLDEIRKQVISGDRDKLPDEQVLIDLIINTQSTSELFSLKEVINATGTIVHTNLGRSILSERVKKQLDKAAFSYTNLEYHLETGMRGSRYQHLEEIIQKLTGAEAAVVVNNNAAAVLLALSTLIPNQKLVISRGELVEIGDSFRIPEIIELSGGTIKEVGTTNKTRLKDYQTAMTDEVGAIMKVHTSNYRIIGFTETTHVSELAKLAREYQIPLINDLGSGLLIDLQKFGLPYEPTIQENIAAGCDIVTFSGDKLLGGPQVGVIVGKKKYIEPMKKNQLLRVLRVDKLTLSALEATLSLYLDSENVIREIPTLQMISKTYEECLIEAKLLEKKLLEKKLDIMVERISGTSQIGGGSYPEHLLPTELVGIFAEHSKTNLLSEKLRLGDNPIVTRVKNDRVWFDVRTLKKSQINSIVDKVCDICLELIP